MFESLPRCGDRRHRTVGPVPTPHRLGDSRSWDRLPLGRAPTELADESRPPDPPRFDPSTGTSWSGVRRRSGCPAGVPARFRAQPPRPPALLSRLPWAGFWSSPQMPPVTAKPHPPRSAAALEDRCGLTPAHPRCARRAQGGVRGPLHGRADDHRPRRPPPRARVLAAVPQCRRRRPSTNRSSPQPALAPQSGFHTCWRPPSTRRAIPPGCPPPNCGLPLRVIAGALGCNFRSARLPGRCTRSSVPGISPLLVAMRRHRLPTIGYTARRTASYPRQRAGHGRAGRCDVDRVPGAHHSWMLTEPRQAADDASAARRRARVALRRTAADERIGDDPEAWQDAMLRAGSAVAGAHRGRPPGTEPGRHVDPDAPALQFGAAPPAAAPVAWRALGGRSRAQSRGRSPFWREPPLAKGNGDNIVTPGRV